jgi:hypothetical protein
MHGVWIMSELRSYEVRYVEGLLAKLERIEQWCKAYPRTVFIEPTDEMWAEANRVLDAAEGCPSLTAISGSNMRYIVDGIQAVAAVDKGNENPLEDMPPLYREKECGERHRWEVIGTTATCIDCLTIQPKREGGVIGPQWVEE